MIDYAERTLVSFLIRVARVNALKTGSPVAAPEPISMGDAAEIDRAIAPTYDELRKLERRLDLLEAQVARVERWGRMK